MRNTLALVSVLVAAAGCYNPDILNRGFACSTADIPACPDGFACVNNVCVKGSSTTGPSGMALTIQKTGAPYAGNHIDPMLDNAAMCPDASLEPNDGPTSAIGFMAPPDTLTSKITKMAICPKGNNPLTGQ